MSKKKKSKLTLAKDTLALLGHRDLQKVGGGWPPYTPGSCYGPVCKTHTA